MIPNRNGYQAYQKNKYETASPHRLIMMLYDGAIRFTNQAIRSLNENEIAASNEALQRVQDIMYELIACLNFEQGKEIAINLNRLYLYVIDCTIKANIEKNTVYLGEVMDILNDIRSSWEQIGKEVSIGNG